MPRKVRLSPPPSNMDENFPFQWYTWFQSVFDRIGTGPVALQGYERLALPPADEWGSLSTTDPFSSLIFVRDATGGPSVAFSDGTNWISMVTGVAV